MTKLRLPLRRLESHAGDAALERVWERIERTRVRHRRGRQALSILVPLAAVVLLYSVLDRPAPAEREELGSSLALSDRSKVRVEEGSRLRVAGNTAEEVRLVLEEGRAEFDVDPTEGKSWSIDCGLITVEVVGTRFSIVRAGDRVDVSVERGMVRVVNERIDRMLIAGERFQTSGSEEHAVSERREADRSERKRGGLAPRKAIDPPRSRRESGTVARGARAPSDGAGLDLVDGSQKGREVSGEVQTNPPAVATFDELMDRADQARSEGRHRDAIELLERASERSDPRAGIAAFTLGRLRSEAGAHRQAAAAFELALALGVPAALLESAMSRAFEAHDDAGDLAEAKGAAARYLDRFPGGRQAAAAREVIAR